MNVYISAKKPHLCQTLYTVVILRRFPNEFFITEPINTHVYDMPGMLLAHYWTTRSFQATMLQCLLGGPIFSMAHHNYDVIKWKHFPRYWPFVWGIHRSSVNSPHKGQSRGALMFPLISACINCWVNNREAGDLRRHRAHYDVTVMTFTSIYNAPF